MKITIPENLPLVVITFDDYNKFAQFCGFLEDNAHMISPDDWTIFKKYIIIVDRNFYNANKVIFDDVTF
jgi:hypothetical protein